MEHLRDSVVLKGACLSHNPNVDKWAQDLLGEFLYVFKYLCCYVLWYAGHDAVMLA